jgi:hypothetical protein
LRIQSFPSQILCFETRKANPNEITTLLTNGSTASMARFIECRKAKLSADKVNSTIDVYTNGNILGPVLLICCTFMPKMEDARLMGMKMKARTVTV